MEIHTSTLIKGILSVGVGSAVAIPAAMNGHYVLGHTYKQDITKWDKSLIDKLKSDGFNFTVNSKNFSGTLSTNNQKIEVSYKEADKPWTWSCEISLKREDEKAGGTFSGEEKDIFANKHTGFLDKIQTSGTENKELKEKFIKECAKNRGRGNNWSLEKKASLTAKDNKLIKSKKEFLLSTIKTETDLEVRSDQKEEFKKWFDSSANLTKWDGWILDAIGEDDGSSLKFTLGDNVNSFPDFTDIPESSPTKQKALFKIQLKTANNSSSNLKSKNKKSDSEGDGTDWEWICNVKLVKEKTTPDKTLEETTKNKIYKHNNDGLFWKITQTGNGNLKRKVVKMCAEARGEKDNKKLEKLNDLSTANTIEWQETNKIISSKTFNLEEANENNLKFDKESQSEFDKYF